MTRTRRPNWWSRSSRTRIPRKFGYDPMRDIQVLSPMHRGAVGVGNLNATAAGGAQPALAQKGGAAAGAGAGSGLGTG